MATLFRPRGPSVTGAGTDQELQLTDSVLIFTWEDATDQYHGFEWRASATAFEKLASSITSDLKRAQCLLNAAIIYARTSQWSEAVRILDMIHTTDDTLALTLFLLGRAHYELQNSERSQECLRIALNQLQDGSAMFEDLEFALEPKHIEQDLATLAQHRHAAKPGGRLPALAAVSILQNTPRTPSAPSSPTQQQPSNPSSTHSEDSSPPRRVHVATQRRRIDSVEYASGDIKIHNHGVVPASRSPGIEASESKFGSSRTGLTSMLRRISVRRPAGQQERASMVDVPAVPELRARSAARDRTPPTRPPRDGTTLPARTLRSYSETIPEVDEVRTFLSSSAELASSKDGPPSLVTDRDSLSDQSTHSKDEGSPTTIESPDIVIVPAGTDGLEAHAVPPPKNPTRRIAAMERAQKLLAERSQNGTPATAPVSAEPRHSDPAARLSRRYARVAGLAPSAARSTSMGPVTKETATAAAEGAPLWDSKQAVDEAIQLPQRSPRRLHVDQTFPPPPSPAPRSLLPALPAPRTPLPALPSSAPRSPLPTSPTPALGSLLPAPPSPPPRHQNHHPRHEALSVATVILATATAKRSNNNTDTLSRMGDGVAGTPTIPQRLRPEGRARSKSLSRKPLPPLPAGQQAQPTYPLTRGLSLHRLGMKAQGEMQSFEEVLAQSRPAPLAHPAPPIPLKRRELAAANPPHISQLAVKVPIAPV